MALEIVRPRGHFMTKVFDLFTVYSIGLVYLMYQCFERSKSSNPLFPAFLFFCFSVAILKPNTSRPANSERYLICEGLKHCQQTKEIRKYLRQIVRDLWDLKHNEPIIQVDINELVPLEIIKKDETFYNFIVGSNEK